MVLLMRNHWEEELVHWILKGDKVKRTCRAHMSFLTIHIWASPYKCVYDTFEYKIR